MDDFPIILRKNETGRRVGLSVRHLERLESKGQFPRRIKLSSNSSGWLESDVREWLEKRIAASHIELGAVAASEGPQQASASPPASPIAKPLRRTLALGARTMHKSTCGLVAREKGKP
jgi:prophage regulatory protein